MQTKSGETKQAKTKTKCTFDSLHAATIKSLTPPPDTHYENSSNQGDKSIS